MAQGSLLGGVSGGSSATNTSKMINKNVSGTVTNNSSNQYFVSKKNSVLSYAPINSTTNQTTVTSPAVAGGGGSEGFGFADTPTGSAASVPNPITGGGLFSNIYVVLAIVGVIAFYIWKRRK
jgi:hypothetical protein